MSSFQANGDGTWQTIGTTAPMEIKVNGYLAVYINNASQITGCVSCSDVFFDQLLVRFTKGNLKEENHYYPFGLPIVALGSQASGFKDNKYKYQSNEYNKEQGLNWMNFHARQYDPQIGRFLSIDPLADKQGQQVLSPYAAMGNAPESLIDPNGESATTVTGMAAQSVFSMLQNTYGSTMFVNGKPSGAIDIASLISDALSQLGGRTGSSITDDYFKNQSQSFFRWMTGSIGSAGGGGDDDRNCKNCPVSPFTIVDESTSEFAGYPSNKEITPFQLGVEWLTGKGPRHRDFTNGDLMTEMLRKHEHVTATKEIILKAIENGAGVNEEQKNSYSLGGVQGVGKYVGDYPTLLTGGKTGNLAVTYLGSYALNWKITGLTNSTATVQFSVFNTSTMQSASRPPVLGYMPAWKNTVGKYINNKFQSGWGSMTSQTFIWTETINR